MTDAVERVPTQMMRSSWGLRAETGGFTLIELLTVIVIMAILATLLSTALSSAKRRARQAVCTSNLRQISMAMNMYLDDETKRPENLPSLVQRKYLQAAGVLRCAEDKSGNWGALVENFTIPPPFVGFLTAPTADTAAAAPSELAGAPPSRTSPSAVIPARGESSWPYSYLHPLGWDDGAWERLMKSDPSAGFAACQLHGLGKQDLNAPSIRNFEGLLLRAQRDGAVVRRQVFWEREAPPARTAALELAPNVQENTPDARWRLFTDKAPE